MQELLRSLEAVSIILILTATGYFCTAAGWFRDEAKSFLSKLLMSVAVPFMCVYGLKSRMSRELLTGAGVLLLVPLFCIGICFLLSWLLGRLLRLPRKSFGVFMMLCALSNTMFIGYPMCMELFGEEAVPYVMAYYMVSTVFTQALGTSLVRWSGESAPFSAKMLLRIFRSPPVVGIIVGVTVVCLEIPLPNLVMSYGKYMNQLVTPLALLITGKIIHDIGLKSLRVDRNIAIVLAFRFLLAPGLCLLLCRLFGVSGLPRSVFVVQAAMPVVSQTVVAASEYGADESLAAQAAAISTLASFLVIPLLMLYL